MLLCDDFVNFILIYFYFFDVINFINFINNKTSEPSYRRVMFISFQVMKYGSVMTI